MNIYTEEIIDHYKNPQNFGRIKDFTFKSKQLNPYCGDEIELFLKFNSRNVLIDAKFQGHGCAISIAAASMLLSNSMNKSRIILTNMKEEDMLDLLGIEISESRKKCALLAFSILKDSLK